MASVATFAEWRDRIVAAIEGLRKMRGGRGIRVDWKGGVPVVVCTLGRGGGPSIAIAKVSEAIAYNQYRIELYSGWGPGGTLGPEQLITSNAYMRVPTLAEGATLEVGTILRVVPESYTDEEPEEGEDTSGLYWTPLEHIGTRGV